MYVSVCVPKIEKKLNDVSIGIYVVKMIVVFFLNKFKQNKICKFFFPRAVSGTVM